jgi:hypothetical protein
MNSGIVLFILGTMIACGYAVTGTNEHSYTKALFAVAWGILAGYRLALAVLS